MTEKLYEIKLAPRQVLLRVAPPEGDRKASLSDIQKELRARAVPYNHQLLFEIYRRHTNEFELLAKREAKNYEVLVDVAPDGLEATMTIVPPDRGQDRLDPARIKQAIREAKLAKGLLYEQIQNAIKKRIENEPVVIARGKKPRHGKDAEVDYELGADDGDGADTSMDSVNLKELNLIKNVEAKELIARIKPPVPGEDGFTVRGDPLRARQGKPMRLKAGSNVEVNSDGTEFRAKVSGYVVRSGEKLSVEDIYQVDQVDGQSGNVRFKGVVVVRGNVEDGFTVESEMGIEVGGSVGKAALKSHGDIRVNGGMIGSTVECRKSVSAKFMSECDVEADEAVSADEYILHSTVQAGKVVRVTGAGTGFINGGSTRAGNYVISPNLGSDVAEEQTLIDVGMRPYLRQRYDALHKGIQQHQLRFEKLRNNLLLLQRKRETEGPLEELQEENFEKNLEVARRLRDEMHEDAMAYRELAGEIAEASGDRGYVFVTNTIHPGVTIQIRGQRYAVQTPLIGTGFRLLNDEVKMHDVGDMMRQYRATHGENPA